MEGSTAHAPQKYLVLITGQFPEKRGDYSFIRHEIREVACRFDRVLIYSFRPVTGPTAELPPNARYMGALSELSPIGSLTALLSPARLMAGAQSLLREWRSGRMHGHSMLVIGNILTGERFAAAIVRGLRRSGADRKSPITAYSFWGSHGALALPFLPAHYRRAVRLHRFDLYEGAGGRLPLRASIFGSCDAVLSISEDGKTYLSERFGAMIPNGALSVARLGTADHGLGPIPKVLSDRGDSDPIRVVSCSSVIDVKRVESIVPAIELLADVRPIHWTHFGSGENLPKVESASVGACVRNENLSIELRGQTENSDVLTHYRDNPVDVFVNVSDSEGVPVSIMEALSFGIPVVATDAGGTGEIVSESLGSGVLLSLRPSPVTLAEAMLSVVERRATFEPRKLWERLSNARVCSRRLAELLSGEPEDRVELCGDS